MACCGNNIQWTDLENIVMQHTISYTDLETVATQQAINDQLYFSSNNN
jgi:hypothetical protein